MNGQRFPKSVLPPEGYDDIEKKMEVNEVNTKVKIKTLTQ